MKNFTFALLLGLAACGPDAPAPAPADPPAAAGAPGPGKGKPDRKDPLAYKVHAFSGGSIATFEGWQLKPLPAQEGWTLILQNPPGKENDFQLMAGWVGASAQELADFFDEGPATVRQLIPGVRAVGEPRRAKFGGDEGLVEELEGENQGKKMRLQVVYVRKKDVAFFVLGAGTEEAYREFGRSITEVAQSLTLKDEPPDPEIVGTWSRTETYRSGDFFGSTHRSITIYPNGTFTDSSGVSADNPGVTALSQGGNRGRVARRGTTLTFQYDSGKVWPVEYKVHPGQALNLGGTLYFR